MMSFHAGMKVLIVDDTELNLMLLEKCLYRLNMQVIKARDGANAVEVFKRESPDMVLMDVVMPGMDGLEATRQIKQQCGDRWVPIILVTSLYSTEDIVSGLDAGAEDYLLKPVSFSILQSKITNFARAIHLQQSLKNNLDELLAYRQAAEAENELAMQVMDKMMSPLRLAGGVAVQHLTLAATHFSGDVILEGETPDGSLQVILADGTGHGLAAAINVMPVGVSFYSMNDRGMSIEEVSRELNKRLRRLMPTGRFVAAVLVSMNPHLREIKVWNGGIPFAAMFDMTGNLVYQWHSAQPPLGLLDNQDFIDTAEVFVPSSNGFFFACSDGLLEAENAHGEPVGLQRVLDWLRVAPAENRLDFILARVREFMGSEVGQDDISIVLIPYTRNIEDILHLGASI